MADDLLALLWNKNTNEAALVLLQHIMSTGKHRDVLALLAIYERAGLEGEEGAGAPTTSPLYNLFSRTDGALKRALRTACELVQTNLPALGGDPDAATWFDLYRRSEPTDVVVWAPNARDSVARVEISVLAASGDLRARSAKNPFLTTPKFEDLQIGIQHGFARLLTDPNPAGLDEVEGSKP